MTSSPRGKVRYVGLSDLPAWVAAQAQTIAHFRGWAPVTALQLEYSLLERTPEGELLPMAQELGIGVLPWSPLRSGQLSGKYVRDNGKPADSHRAGLIEGPTGRDWDVIEAVAASRRRTRRQLSRSRARLGTEPTRDHLDADRRAYARAAAVQPGLARRHARRPNNSPLSKSLRPPRSTSRHATTRCSGRCWASAAQQWTESNARSGRHYSKAQPATEFTSRY